MSRFDEPQFEPLLEKLRTHLREERYGTCARFSYPYAARSFLRYLEHRGQSLEAVTSADVDRYLDSRRLKGSRRPLPEAVPPHASRGDQDAAAGDLRAVAAGGATGERGGDAPIGRSSIATTRG